MRMLTVIRNQAGLLKYAACNYVDKFLTFAVPLLVLYVFRDKSTYNEIEYIYSIAAVISIVIDVGMSTYFFYAYRDASDRERLIMEMESSFLLQFALYAVLGGALAVILAMAGTISGTLYLFVAARALTSMFLAFYTVYYRLVDRPARVFLISISVNVGTVIAIVSAGTALGSVSIWSVFVSQMALIVLAVVYFSVRKNKVPVAVLVQMLSKAMRFAWPVMLNLFLFMFVANYGKVYARNFLPSEDMFHISFVQRISLIIQLAHASAVGYLAKRIFVERAGQINPRVILLYSMMIAGGVVMVLSALIVTAYLPVNMSVGLDAVTVLMILYTVVWCYAAFFELYVNRMNKNVFILLFSLVSAAVFVGFLNFGFGSPLINISVAMLVSMTCNLALTVWYVFRQKGVECNEETAVADYSNVAVQ
jgi:hypothetical protein